MILASAYLSSYTEYTINGKTVRISGQIAGLKSCEDKNVLRKLAEIGVKTIDNGPSSCAGATITLATDDKSQIAVTLEDDKLLKISNARNKQIAYYSTDAIDDIYSYTTQQLIKSGDEKLKQARDAKLAIEKQASKGIAPKELQRPPQQIQSIGSVLSTTPKTM